MKFSLFFLTLTAYLIYLVLVIESNVKYILSWPLINLGLMTIAYSLNKPEIILGKNSTGKINKLLLVLNLPWLLLTWSSLYTALLLIKKGEAENKEDALKMIEKSRSLAKPNAAQKKWLLTDKPYKQNV